MDLTKYYPDIVAKYPAYVTKRELCEICHICPKTAYNLEQQGEIPYTIEQNHLIRSHKIKLTDILAYYPCAYSTSDREYNKVLANYFNAHESISKAQAAAMLAGSMFGWNVPAADPACYDAEGIPIQPGEKKAPTRSPEYQYEQAKLIRQNYQPGTKVVLDEKMEDPYREMPAGLTGIVDSVDDLGQIHCHWENGSSLALIPGVDHFHQDMTQEPVIESSEEQEPDLEL